MPQPPAKLFAPTPLNIAPTVHVIINVMTTNNITIIIAAAIVCLLALTTVGCTLLAKGAGNSDSFTASDGTVLTGITYGPDQRNNYDLYLPPSGKAKSDGLIVCIHGGSWMGGDKDDLAHVCKRYCKAGYVTASVDYRVIAFTADNHITLPVMDADIHAALQHILANLSQRGIRIRNMALWGYSAGSQLAMAYALNHDTDAPCPIRFVVDQVGPADLPAMFPASDDQLRALEQMPADNKMRLQLVNLVYRASGTWLQPGMFNKATVDSLMAVASPAHLLATHRGVPTIMTYGDKDDLVKPDVRKSTVAAYDQWNVPYTLILYPNSGHDLSNDPASDKQLHKTVNQYLKKYFK